MYKLLGRNTKVLAVVVFAAVVVFVLAANAIPLLSKGDYRIGTLTALVGLIVIALGANSWSLFCRLPSRWRPKWGVDLGGTWTGTILSEWRTQPSDVPPMSTPVTVIIHQNWFRFSVIMETDKTSLRSLGPHIIFDNDANALNIQCYYETDSTARSGVTNPPETGFAQIVVGILDRRKISAGYTKNARVVRNITLSRS